MAHRVVPGVDRNKSDTVATIIVSLRAGQPIRCELVGAEARLRRGHAAQRLLKTEAATRTNSSQMASTALTRTPPSVTSLNSTMLGGLVSGYAAVFSGITGAPPRSCPVIATASAGFRLSTIEVGMRMVAPRSFVVS